MFEPFSKDYEWRSSSKGNHVLIVDDELCATVFHNRYCWRIILNRGGVGYLVENEAFDDDEVAKHRAEEIVDSDAEGVSLQVLPKRPW